MFFYPIQAETELQKKTQCRDAMKLATEAHEELPGFKANRTNTAKCKLQRKVRKGH
jgi:hypothetical protein